MKKLIAILAILTLSLALVCYAAQPNLPDNRWRIPEPVLHDSPFFPPDPSEPCIPCGEVVGPDTPFGGGGPGGCGEGNPYCE